MSGQAPDISSVTEPPVAANLCRFQKAAGLTNAEFAEALGHHDDRQITRWRNGHVTPTWATLCDLAPVLGVTPIDFYTEPDPQLPEAA